MNKEQLKGYYQAILDNKDSIKNFSAFAEQYCKANNIEYTDTIRRAGTTAFQFCNNVTISRGVLEESVEAGIDPNNVKYGWYKSKRFSLKFDNHTTPTNYLEAFEKIASSIKPVDIVPESEYSETLALSVILSDLHIGMNIDEKYSLFGHSYNNETFLERIERVKQEIWEQYMKQGKLDMFVLKILGDALDGYDKKTTRGGHELPQNMSSLDMFNTYVETVVGIVSFAIENDIADKFRVQLVGNDNHGGSFAEIANSAIQMLLIHKYPKAKLKVDCLIKFIEQFNYGNHTFLMTHGKDAQFQFKGLSFNLNDKDYKFIENYIRHHEIEGDIHVIKGDLHNFNYSANNLFDYENIGSFAPPSNWASHNFGNNAKQGFTIHLVEKWGSITRKNVYFN